MKAGFTLIEVVVVMAILSILAGVLVPMTINSIDRANETATLQNIQLLKKAMIGDPQLIQNGIRTDFGFVGDIGALPRNMEELIANPSNYSKWKGPYIVTAQGGILTDSWGRAFKYIADIPDIEGRTVSAAIRSAGIDGVFDTSDDLFPGDDKILGTADDTFLGVTISKEEVTPGLRLRVSPLPPEGWGIILEVKYNTPLKPTGDDTLQLECKTIAADWDAYVDIGRNMPIGYMTVTRHLYTNCSGTSESKGEEAINVYANSLKSTIPVAFGPNQ